MFDRLGIQVLAPGPRFAAQTRFWVNGEDLVEQAVGPGGYGPSAVSVFPVGRPGLLRATGEPRRVELGEPECTGGCCGFLSAVVQRFGNVVRWSDWEVPADGTRPLEFDFEADRYEAELARVEAPGWRRRGRARSRLPGRE
ncbi:hypothetical protein [Kitasatospora sp. NBC_01266]|uniref:hypothetical protein n=1 Tax=Kitasatospora sp. NBC_01266 TaxID=2903572 RepID=UPI002E341A49|nr:hypothetical protein [Kitasatospora sp. NBC_01266]